MASSTGTAPGFELRQRTRAAEILLVGGDDWALSEAAQQLVGLGRRVHRCSDRSEAPFPCNAMIEGRGCPLDQHEVDVVLAVMSRPRTEPSMAEMGAVCGLRDGIPLVIAGLSEGSPLAAWAARVPADGDIVATCDQAVTASGRARPA